MVVFLKIEKKGNVVSGLNLRMEALINVEYLNVDFILDFSHKVLIRDAINIKT